jgi:hypothetical protein
MSTGKSILERRDEAAEAAYADASKHAVTLLGDMYSAGFQDPEVRALEEIVSGIIIEPDPNGGMQLVVKYCGSTYRLRLGEIHLRATLDAWIEGRNEALNRYRASLAKLEEK